MKRDQHYERLYLIQQETNRDQPVAMKAGGATDKYKTYNRTEGKIAKFRNVGPFGPFSFVH